LCVGCFDKEEGGNLNFEPGFSITDVIDNDDVRNSIRINRQQIYRLLINNEIVWRDCEEEIKHFNDKVKFGKDFFGNDVDALYLPAIERFCGGFFTGLGLDRKIEIAKSSHHFLIVSALYGLLRPFEQIQDHACQFGDKNVAYDIWTRNHQISAILSEYVNKFHIKRIFDFTFCEVPAYHECINWDFIKRSSGAEVFHCYHKFATRDQVLNPFGKFIRKNFLTKPAEELLSISPGATIEDIRFSDKIKLSESESLRRLIEEGENDQVEFKSSVLWSLYLSNEDIKRSESSEIKKYQKNASKFIIARSIVSFLNTKGGNLIIGVKEDKLANQIKIIGISDEYFKLREGDRNPDGFRLMIIESIVKKFIPDLLENFSDYINISFHTISGNIVCWLRIQPGKQPIFVEINNEELFFIRTDASTRSVIGKNLARYILNRFPSHGPP
jgi:hypothetical protein